MSRTSLLLLLVCLLAAIPMLYFGATYYIEYDGYWHVFIAKLAWSDLLSEYQATAHPPLFFVLLKAAAAIGDSRLIYRLVSILSGIGAIFVIGRIASKVTGSTLTAVLTAFVFGFSESAILISLEVRSYMLCAFFVLLAFYYYLDIVPVEPGPSERRARIGYSVSLCLAVLSHYSALFFLVACMTAPLSLAVLNKDYRIRLFAWMRGRWFANLLTILPVAALGLGLYLFQGKTFATPLAYLSQFYFNPAGPESRMAFLSRNLQNTFNLFSPVPAGGHLKFAAALALCCFAAAAVSLGRIRCGTRNILAAITIAVFLSMAGVFMVASLEGRYPFGGGLRHQFLLFPFLVLSALLLFERLAAAMQTKQAQSAVLALGFVAGGANANAAYGRFPNIRNNHATRDIAVFRNLFPNADAVMVDQFSSINFFTHYSGWKWRRTGRYDSLYTYGVSRNGKQFVVLRDKSRWNFDFAEAGLYPTIKRALASSRAHSVTVFCMDQFASHVPGTAGQEQIFRKNVRRLASQAGVQLEQLFVDGVDVYADFVDARGDAQPPERDVSGPALFLAQPQETTVETKFAVQPNGYSAVSMTGRNFERGAVILANGRRLDTVFENARSMTALFPSDLYGAAGVVALKAINPDGKSSNTIDFLILPK